MVYADASTTSVIAPTSAGFTRRFLVLPGAWRPDSTPGVSLRQGYLSCDTARTVLVEVAGDAAYLTVNGMVNGISRLEFEFPIEVAAAETLLSRLCLGPLLEKRCYRKNYGGWDWNIEVFEGENAGLIVAEVEVQSEVATVVLPSWIGREVSDDPRYFDSNLARDPFTSWGSTTSS